MIDYAHDFEKNWGVRTNAFHAAMPYRLDHFYAMTVTEITFLKLIRAKLVDASETELVLQENCGKINIVNRKFIVHAEEI